jgi:gamma-glutamylcyclotransferase (GGCT)/AIG2-like uncharacterized protein YtfP
MASVLLFVYGTLKRGMRNHARLAGQEFIGEAVTQPFYRLWDRGPYPCMVEDRQRGLSVRGELWRVEESFLPRLDAFEGAPGAFLRVAVPLSRPEGSAQAYLYQDDVIGFADGGDFWAG